MMDTKLEDGVNRILGEKQLIVARYPECAPYLSIKTIQVLNDTPVIGAWEERELNRSLYGPYPSLQEMSEARNQAITELCRNGYRILDRSDNLKRVTLEKHNIELEILAGSSQQDVGW